MKKTVLIAVLILLGTCAFAQGGLLKGLGDKAKNAVGSQLGKAVSGSLGLGGNGSQESNASGEDYPPVALTYAQDLLDPEANENYLPLEDPSDAPVYNSYLDALNARIALPASGSLNSAEALRAYGEKVARVRKATVDMCTRYALKQSDLTKQTMNGPSAGSSSGAENASNISAAEIMKAISDAGLNPATASEDQIRDVVAGYVAGKTGMSKEQAIEMMAKGAPEGAGENRMNQIEKELYAIYDARVMSSLNSAQNALAGLQAALLGGQTAADETTLDGALQALRTKILAAWPASEECKSVNKLEREQGPKSRPRQDEIIDKWNARQLDLWVAKISMFQEAEAADALKAAQLDAELDAMPESDKKTSDWASAKMKAVMLNGLILSCMEMPAKVFDCPLVHHAPEAID